MKSKSRRQNFKNKLSQASKSVQAVRPEDVVTEEIVLQYGSNEITTLTISDKVKNSYKESGNQEQIKEMKIYVKPEENQAYYVINGGIDGSVDLA